MVSGISHFWKTSRIRFWATSWSAAEPPGRSHQVNTYFISHAPFPSSHRSGCAHNSKLGRIRASSKRGTFGPFAANFVESPECELRDNGVLRSSPPEIATRTGDATALGWVGTREESKDALVHLL